MEGAVVNVATHVAESLAKKAMQELKYLYCYKSNVVAFETERLSLSARRNTVLKEIKEAKDRNENQIESDVELWLRNAEALINEDTKDKKKWFGLVPNCFWQINRSKDLEDLKEKIQPLVEQSNNFKRVARSTGLPGIEFYSNENFVQLKDRKLQFGKLMEALKNDKKFVIGLYGLGGTGKTTMAIEVGKEIESKVFNKVIFSVVSKDANLKKIRHDIAKHLNLPLKEGIDESEQAHELWKRIAEGEEKVLLILDDVWEKLSLHDIGIPKGCCSILLTTRDWKVCRDMGCHETFELEVLNEQDAVDLFLSYAGQSIDDSFNDFKDLALDIVKECGTLPVAIEALARALKFKPLKEWKQGLERLRNPKSIHDVNEDLKEAYNSLRLSYDYLENKEAKQLFLLCSLFPDDYEIPIELLTRIAIGMGLCGGADKYSVARSYFTPIKNVLMDSCLLLKAENEAVKMHDLVREVALWIGNKLVQVVMDSSTTLMENIQYSSWNIIDLSNHFDGRKLEVLLLWISNNADSTTIKVPYGIFEGMENLKFLALMNWSNIRISGAFLFQSHPSFINVRTLAIKGFELGDISIMENLKSLESVELRDCSMIELPKEIRKLEMLRLLEMVQCFIERNNPFEVIGSCLQLEELYFVSNRVDKACESLPQITTFPKLQKYQIKSWSGFSYHKVDFSISGYFDSEYLRVNFSDEIFKYLVARAEVLKLDGDYKRGWTNVVPDILPVQDDSKEDHLTRLFLQSMNGIKCLIRRELFRSNVAIFSKLVELELHGMEVRELCCGPYPLHFLKQLEKLHLSWCENLQPLLFNGKLELYNLKSIHLHNCSMACLFLPFTAQSLKKLEILHIDFCSGLKYIVEERMEDHDPKQKSHDSMFPKLKYLKVMGCHELEFILPLCFCKDLPLLASMEIVNCKKLKYIFGQYLDERYLHQMGKEAILQSLEELQISEVPNFIDLYANVEDCTSSLSRGRLCCFWPKSNASAIYHPFASTNHNKAMKVNYVVKRAHGLFTPPLYPYTLLRRMEIFHLSGLKSLFTLSIVSSLELLEILKVGFCHPLEHIVADKENDHDHMNDNSIFPKLREVIVFSCSDLEYLFPAIYSKGFKDLEFVSITNAKKLTHVFGKCQVDQNHNGHIDLNLPALKRLYLCDIPNIISICAQNYSMKKLYLEDISLERYKPFPWETSIDYLLMAGLKRQEDLSRIKALPPLDNLQELPEFKELKSYMSFQNLSKLTIKGYKQLKYIFSATTSRSLQKLRKLEVEGCEELVSIIEDQENNKNPMAPHQVLFLELRTIEVRGCKSMEYLFSISSGKFPRLLYVGLQETPQLGEVFRWKHGEGQKLVMEDVFPKLCMIKLVNLPTLHTICQGIDFHTVKLRRVRECPAISLTSANGSYDELKKLLQSFERSSVHEDEDASYVAKKCVVWAYEAEGEGEHKRQNRISPNLSEIEVEGSQQDIGNDSTMPQQNNGLSNFENSEEVSKEIAEEDTTTESNLPNFTKSTKISANEIVEEKLSTTPSSNLDMSEEASKDADEKDSTIQKQESSSPNLTEVEGKGSQEYIGNDLTMPQQNNASPNIKKSKEVPKEIAKNDSSTHKLNSNLSNLTESINASANEIVEEKLSTTLSSNSNVNTKTSKNEIVEEQPPTSNAAATPSSKSNRDNLVHKKSSSTHFELTISNLGKTASTKELCGKESKCDQEAHGEGISLNEDHQRVKEPTNDLFTKETTKKVALSEEVSKEIAVEDSTTNSNLPNLTKSTKTSANEIVEEKLSTAPLSDLDMNLKATFEEGPSSKKYGKASSSKLRGKESIDDNQQAHGESISSNEAPQRIEELSKEWSLKETSNEVSLKIPPPSVTKMTSALSSSISSPKKPQIATSTSHKEMESDSSQSHQLTISTITDESLQEKIMNQLESSTAKQVKFDQGNHQQFAEDDLMKLFQIMEEGAEMEVQMPHVTKIAAVHDDNELIKALADLEGSLKMSLNEIARSKESIFRLENALNILSSHYSEHGAPSHGLQTTIHTLQQEIQNVLSSSKQACATIDTFNKLEHKEKLFIEERSKRKEAAVALLSEIYNKESSLAEASLKEAELKEQISTLQAELDRKGKQVQDYEMELISLKEQKKNSVYDTMGFIKEFEIVKKERSHIVEENMKAKEHIQNMDVKWSSCLSNLKKTTLLLGVHLQQKL